MEMEIIELRERKALEIGSDLLIWAGWRCEQLLKGILMD
jgi:hypothetical protein